MKLAVIGASTGQLPLCKKAKELGLRTICFAWPKEAVCKDAVDKFYPISIREKDVVVDICMAEQIDGVVSNASDFTAEIVSYVSTHIHLHGIDYENFLKLKDKSVIRQMTSNVNNLCQVRSYSHSEAENVPFPCVVKPKTGAAKKGVVFVNDLKGLKNAIKKDLLESEDVIIEEYISGREISVETISYEGKHYVIQITDKENSGAPHFVELAHHQPSSISKEVWGKIERIVPDMLDAVGFRNGASHIEMKVDGNNNVYLIEINPRGGGDEISNTLVQLSTGYDYLKGMIDVALGQFRPPVVKQKRFSGIYYLCKQNADLLPVFLSKQQTPWLIEKKFDSVEGLSEAIDNYSRNGYLIYQWNKKVVL